MVLEKIWGVVPRAQRRKWRKETWEKLKEKSKPISIAVGSVMVAYAVYKISKSVKYGGQEKASEMYQVQRLKW